MLLSLCLIHQIHNEQVQVLLALLKVTHLHGILKRNILSSLEQWIPDPLEEVGHLLRLQNGFIKVKQLV